MAIIEQSALMRRKDENGNECIFYPITTIDCVDGAEDLVHFDKEQELTAGQKAQFLKNIGGLCAPANAQANKFLKISAVDANGNVTAVEAVDVEGGSSESGSVEQVQADWNVTDETAPAYIKNKPFGEEEGQEELLPLTTYDGFAIEESFGLYIHQEQDSSYSLIVGEYYTIEWDGVTYECVGQDASAVFGVANAVAIGNGSAFGYIGNNEPFIIVRLNDNWKSYVSLTDTEAGGSHNVRIAKDVVIVNQIDSKFIPSPSWEDLQDKPFYDNSGVEVIKEEVTYTDFGLNSTYGLYCRGYSNHDYQLIVGESYIVSWDGVAYECEARDASTVLGSGSVGLGNGSSIGLLGNHEPFLIVATGEYKVYASTTDTEAGGSHSVSIARKVIDIKQIDPKYSPVLDYIPETTELLPLTTYDGFAINPEFNLYMHQEQDDSYSFIVGETYIVTWDGATYECVGQDVSAIFGVAGAVGMGNGSAFGLIGNNEPFVITSIMMNDSEWKSYVSLTDTEAGGSHTVRISRVNPDSGYKVDEKYIPEFARTTLFKERILSFTYFLQDNYIASVKPVSFSLTDGEMYVVVFDGVEYETNKAAVDDAGYVCIGNLKALTEEDNGMPFTVGAKDGQMVCTTVLTDATHTLGIYKRVKLINDVSASSLPEVTAEDNGKFLQVVNGVWAAVTVANAEEVSF